jgi:hypothetical protein
MGTTSSMMKGVFKKTRNSKMEVRSKVNDKGIKIYILK